MATWLSADEVARLFVVQPETLVSYSARGNLGVRTDVRGRRVFSIRQVESLFPRRGADGRRSGATLGTLGVAKLGANSAAALSDHSGYRNRIKRRGDFQSPIITKHLGMAKIA